MLGRVALALALLAGLLVPTLEALAATPYAASYTVPSLPASVGASSRIAVQVTVTNTGTERWNATGANPVNLGYHWYTASGANVIWDGIRTALGADVAPGASRTIKADVIVPSNAGSYLLRFAMVKEGVGWFEPEPTARAVTVLAAYAATLGAVSLPALVAAGTYTVNVPVTNAGSFAWIASGPNLVNLAYHWYDAQGKVVVWDGLRTPLGGDLAPGQTRTIAAKVAAPPGAGPHTLSFDLVREGLGWFGQPLSVAATVQAATFRATYTVAAMSSGYIGESKTIPVTVTNAGNVAWSASGPNIVRASYHWVEPNGKAVVWDGARTPLSADVAPGASQNLQLAVVLPPRVGTFQLQVDLVREGVAWFSSLGSPTANYAFQISSGFGAGYGADTTPSTITPNAGIPISIQLTNTGQRAWQAGGTNPVRLSYHMYTSAGALVAWDGLRGLLPKDVAPGTSLDVELIAKAPGSTGNYRIVLDMVQEGVAWFSSFGVATKYKDIQVFPGVTVYGKGWGHGVGLSQWGAQGWALGAAGQPLTGEQIVMKYYPGAQIAPFTTGKSFRVLLSQPSTGCNARTVTSLAQLRSEGGVWVLNEAANRQPLLRASPSQTIRVWVEGNILKVMDEWSAKVIYSGSTPIILQPVDTSKPTTVVQKGRWYRGDLRFEIAGYGMLRVVNWINPDDYARGSVPVEMLTGWHVEAYKAQAYAAKTYAAWKQATMGAVAYDLRDDTSDQCYGGASVETTIVNTAVAATAGKILTYGGAPIRAYYASSHGGASDSNGCIWNIVGSAGGGYRCGNSEPYLAAVADPADLVAAGPSGINPHRSWARTFTAAQIEYAVRASGWNIGAFISLDLSNRAPGGHVIAVKVTGTGGSVWLSGDTFLRLRLGLKSTMVRTFPF